MKWVILASQRSLLSQNGGVPFLVRRKPIVHHFVMCNKPQRDRLGGGFFNSPSGNLGSIEGVDRMPNGVHEVAGGGGSFILAGQKDDRSRTQTVYYNTCGGGTLSRQGSTRGGWGKQECDASTI